MKRVLPILLVSTLCCVAATVVNHVYTDQKIVLGGVRLTNVRQGPAVTDTTVIGVASTDQTNNPYNLVVDTSMTGVGSVVLLATHFDIGSATADAITSTNGTWSKIYSYTNASTLTFNYWLLTNKLITAGTVISNSITQAASNNMTMALFALTNPSVTLDVAAQNYGFPVTSLIVSNAPTTNGTVVGFGFASTTPPTNNWPILRATNITTGIGASQFGIQYISTNISSGLLTNTVSGPSSTLIGSWVSLKSYVAPEVLYYITTEAGTYITTEAGERITYIAQ